MFYGTMLVVLLISQKDYVPIGAEGYFRTGFVGWGVN